MSSKSRPGSSKQSYHKSSSKKSSHKLPAKQSSYKSSPPREHRKATSRDFQVWEIPEDYSPEEWDPDETPIVVAGSIFDAYTFGKCICDWTRICFGEETPQFEVAGELWLDLVRLAARIKRAERGRNRAREDDDKEMLDEFIISGKRLWKDAEILFKDCEWYMWEDEHETQLRDDSGEQLVEALFRPDRERDWTESLMPRLYNWLRNFKKHAQPVLEFYQKRKAPAPETPYASKSQTFSTGNRASSTTAPRSDTSRQPSTW